MLCDRRMDKMAKEMEQIVEEGRANRGTDRRKDQSWSAVIASSPNFIEIRNRVHFMIKSSVKKI